MVRHERQLNTQDLLSTLDSGVLSLTLNRPDARNAMSDAMLDALNVELQFADASPDVRCVVLRGAGYAFCAGGDVKSMSARPAAGGVDKRIRWQRGVQRDIAGRLHEMTKPTLAVVNGPAAGAGCALALACDLRVMSESAFLLTAFASVGLSGDFGAAYFLTHLIGSARARELMFLSERVSATRALELGLANWICAPFDLEERASAVASSLANGPTTAFGYMKENLNRALTADLTECMDVEVTHHIHCEATADYREGVASFVEKRVPNFSGC